MVFLSDLMSCHLPKTHNKKNYEKSDNIINIALAGNPNVGKSVIFNQLTGLSQTIGNWPGKTIERMEGSLEFLGYHFNIVDLPGIYSLSTYSLEEIVSRDYIVSDNVDLIVNVIDATNLERNLFFTFQLLELKIPMIIAINQMDMLQKRNRDLDFNKLAQMFKLPVIPLVAVHGKRVHEILEVAIELYNNKDYTFPDLSLLLTFGKEIENKLAILTDKLLEYPDILRKSGYPPRFLVIKLLENDEEIISIVEDIKYNRDLIETVDLFRRNLEDFHGEDIQTIISSEIYNNINKVIEEVLIEKSQKERTKMNLVNWIDHLTTHSFFGYLILLIVLLGTYFFTFTIGDFLGGIIDEIYSALTELVHTTFDENYPLIQIIWDGAGGGFFGALSGVLVYVVPFFLIIEILQDSGYLPRAAFLMDRAMHSLGVHGKTVIPMILGFGCNVPACAGCRIMETEREKKISIALTSLVPCAAVMTVVMGLVGRYLGLGWVGFLFIINFSVVLLMGRILNKFMSGRCTELIMEMHEYRAPNFEVIIKQTWLRSKEFVYKALPIIILLGIGLEILVIFNILLPINIILSPITVFWLGLPIVTGVFLIYGILRKELTLVLLVLFAENMGMTLIDLLTPIQMITFSLVTMLYVPCFATIIIIAKQTSWKYALQISFLEISIALLIGGIFHFGFAIFGIF